MKILLVALFIILTHAFGAMANAQTANPCDTPNKLPSSFFEVPAGPQGNWTLLFTFDKLQSNDPQVPVVVASAGAIQGPAARRGLRLGCGDIQNRSQQQVVAVRLRWILARAKDRLAISQDGYTHDNILIVGSTPPIELSIAKDAFRGTDFSVINFVEVTKSLVKDGVLSGDYVLVVGVEEAQFADGSVWKASRP